MRSPPFISQVISQFISQLPSQLTPKLAILCAAALLAAVAPVHATVAPAAGVHGPVPDPVYEAGSHYTATLHQRAGLWRLQPADGQDLSIAVAPGCEPGAEVPPGVWLLVRNSDGIALRAPSATRLPSGHGGEIPVRDCDAQDAAALHLPASLIDLLAEHAGSVHVD